MKKSTIKIASISLAALLALGGTGLTIHAYNKSGEDSTALEQVLTNSYSARNVQNTGSDNLYIITNADGSIDRVLDNSNLSVTDTPVKINISYLLNGSAISPEELAGKSGHITIRFDYENLSYETVTINGQNEKMYIPYAMISGLILDD